MCWGSRDQEVPGVSLPTFSTRESRPGRGAERPLSEGVGAVLPHWGLWGQRPPLGECRGGPAPSQENQVSHPPLGREKKRKRKRPPSKGTFENLGALTAQAGMHLLLLELLGIKIVVVAALLEQLLVLALLHNLAVLDHQNQVGLAGWWKAGAQSGKKCRPSSSRSDRALNQLLGLGVDRAGRLVQHKDGRVGQHRARKGDQLLLAGGELVAALADVAVVAVFQVLAPPCPPRRPWPPRATSSSVASSRP